jgi:hypothetical protein
MEEAQELYNEAIGQGVISKTMERTPSEPEISLGKVFFPQAHTGEFYLDKATGIIMRSSGESWFEVGETATESVADGVRFREYTGPTIAKPKPEGKRQTPSKAAPAKEVESNPKPKFNSRDMRVRPLEEK